MPLLKYDGTAARETAAPTVGLYGTSAYDILTGTPLNESLWGGEGDLLTGGLGDDSYYIRSAFDLVVEKAGEGVDLVTGWRSLSLNDYANVENVRVSGDNLYAAGNALDNVVEGGVGKEQIYGGGGQDVLVGGAGADVFIVVKGEGNDVIQDFAAGEDKVRLRGGFTNFDQVRAALSQVGSDVKLDLGGGDGLIFRNLLVANLTAANFQLELDRTRLGPTTFAEEFAGALSIWDRESNPTGRWRPDYGYQGSQGAGSYSLISNDEKQIYTSPYFRDHPGDFQSPFVSNADGTMSIWARPSTSPEIFGYGYTSGLITTKESFSQTYGYFEMRADIPDTAGAWPAFWMLPADGSWPPEIDIMEVLTYDANATWTTAHSKASGSHVSQGQMNYTPDTGDGFHTYGVLWSPTALVWYIDGVEVFRTATPADLNKPMYLLANMALGGWGGALDPAGLPAEFKIDYIRAYDLPGLGDTPPVGKTLVAQASGSELTGAGGGDTIDGGAGVDRLQGADGDDIIRGGGGGDDLNGNAGNDSLYGGDGQDWLTGGLGADLLSGGDGDDIVQGNQGADTCEGGAGNDTVRGGQGDDVVRGGDGADWLTGDAGNDVLSGGAGADTFHSFVGAGRDLILDFNANEGDRLLIRPATAWTAAQVDADTIVTLSDGAQIVLAGVQLSTLPEGWLYAG